VIDHGQVCFAGGSRDLTAMAADRVWESDAPDPTAWLSWLTGDGRYRQIGEPPLGSDLVPPTPEDGYLLLLGTPHISRVRG
jgi:ABC-2 type transport system ATP-binding protein